MQKDPKAEQTRLGDIASEPDPRRAPWGYYCSDDHVFGVGLFLWFKTKDELLRFLAEYEASQSEEHDQDVLRSGMRKIATQVSAGRLGLEKARLRFDGVLKGYIQIEWMGHFDEILSGKHPFSRKLRTEFLEVKGGNPVPAIPSHRVGEFIDYLRNYGH